MTHESIEEFSTEEFDRTFKTNVYAMFWLCKAAVPRLNPGSVIINTASIQSYNPSPNPCLCVHEGSHRELHEGPVEDGLQAGHPSERRGPGSRLDTAHSKHDAGREGKRSSVGIRLSAEPLSRANWLRCTCSSARMKSNYVTGEVYGATGGQTPY